MALYGWQSLASERFTSAVRERILPEIQRVHPTAWETQIGSDYAYFIGPKSDPVLIGVAWNSRDLWRYAVMNEIAFDLGARCTLVHIRANGRNRIEPGILPGTESGILYRDKATEKAPEKVADRPIEQAPTPPLVDELPLLAKQWQEPLTRPSSLPMDTPSTPKVNIYRQGDGWYKWVETKNYAREFGPFPTRRQAETAR